MNSEELKKILTQVQEKKLEVDDALRKLEDFPYSDLGFAKIDHHREIRTGYPEIIFCEGKTTEQVRKICEHMYKMGGNIIATRANRKMFDAIKKTIPSAKYYNTARIINVQQRKVETGKTYIAIVTAGTSDIPVAEEAAVTAELLGSKVERIFDVGVAGLHRLVELLPEWKVRWQALLEA
jgi:NCAIR mutase (PurE)-related protein